MFDPYHKWLGIPKDQRPPTHYQLLGITPTETDPEVIEEAAVRQTTHVRAYQIGPHAADCTRILNELAQARQTLLNPAKRKAYDVRIQQLRTDPAAGDARITARPTTSPAAAENVFEHIADDDSADVPIRRRESATPSIQRDGAGWVLPVAIVGGIAVVGVIMAAGWLLLRQSAERRRIVIGPNPPIVAPDPEPVDPQPVDPRPVDPKPVDPKPRPMPFPMPMPGVEQPIAGPVLFEQQRFDIGPGIVSLAWTSKGRFAVLGGDPPRLFDLEAGKVVHAFGEAQGPGNVGLAVSGETLYTLRENDQVVAWRIETGEKLSTIPMRAKGSALAVSRDGRTLIFQRDDLLLSVWDLAANREQGTLEPSNGQRRPLACVAIAPDGRHAFTGHQSGVFLWDLATRTQLGGATNFAAFSAAYHPDGLVATAVPWSIHVYDERFARKHAVDSRCTDIKFAPDGRLLVGVAASTDKQLSVFEWPTLNRIRLYQGKYTAVAMAPDGHSVLAYETGGVLRRLALPPPSRVAVVPIKPEVKPEVKPQPAAVGRKPVPPDEQRQAVAEVIHETHAKEFARKTNPERAALAEKLIKQAEDTPDSEVDRYVLYSEARELAAGAGRPGPALRALDGLVREFEVDEPALRRATLDLLAKSAVTTAAFREVGDAALAAAQEAAFADRYETARQYLAIAKAAAPKVLSKSYIALVQNHEVNIEETAKEHGAYDKVQAMLKANPDDASANLMAGRFLTFRKGDWEHGLPHLAKGGDAPLAVLARQDAKAPQDAQAQAELGDAWWEAGQKENELVKPILYQRALHWYLLAQPQLTGAIEKKIAARVRVIDETPSPLHSRQRLAEVRKFKAHGSPITSLAIGPDGKKLFTGSLDGFVKGWALGGGKQFFSWPNTLPVHSFALSPDLAWLACCSEDRVRIYDVKTSNLKPRRDMGTKPGAFWLDDDSLFRVDGETFWSHEINNGSGGGSRVPGDSPVKSTVASPDRRMVAVLCADVVVLIRMSDRFTQGPPAVFRGSGASAAAFSADNRLLALSEKDGTIRVYDVASRKELTSLRGHGGNVRALAFAAGRLLSGGDDRSVRLWDIDAGKEIARASHTGAVLALAATADGRRAFSAGADLNVREWDLPLR